MSVSKSIDIISNDVNNNYLLRNLKILDVAGETDITDLGLHAIAHGICKNITYIDIGMLREENICHEDISLLIMVI